MSIIRKYCKCCNIVYVDNDMVKQLLSKGKCIRCRANYNDMNFGNILIN